MLKALIILIEMIFLHFIADYYLQGILADMKQRSWWVNKLHNESELNRSKYKDDYKVALIAHSFEWAFMVMLPMLYTTHQKNYIFPWTLLYVTVFVYNVWIHGIIDNSKANKRSINLIKDQWFHIIQIFFSWLLWWAILGWN